eukprot:538986_1
MANKGELGPPHCPYEKLGLDPLCSDEDIRKAYRRQALMHHPDRHDPERREEAAERFRHATEAYEKLNDPDSRKAYDRSTLKSRPSSSRDINDFYDDDDDGFVSFGRDMERTRFSSRVNRCNNNRQRQRRHESAFDIFDQMRSTQSSVFPSMFNESFRMRSNMGGSMMEEMMRGFDEDFNELMGGMHSFSGDSFFKDTSNLAFTDMNAPRRTSSISVRSYSVTAANGQTFTRSERSTRLGNGRTNTVREDFINNTPSSYHSTSRRPLGN